MKASLASELATALTHGPTSFGAGNGIRSVLGFIGHHCDCQATKRALALKVASVLVNNPTCFGAGKNPTCLCVECFIATILAPMFVENPNCFGPHLRIIVPYLVGLCDSERSSVPYQMKVFLASTLHWMLTVNPCCFAIGEKMIPIFAFVARYKCTLRATAEGTEEPGTKRLRTLWPKP